MSHWNDEKAAAMFAAFVKNRTWQTPTLLLFRVWWLAATGDPSYWSDPNLDLMPADWVNGWRPERDPLLSYRGPEAANIVQRMKAWYESELMVTRRMHDARVPFLAGTDVSQWNHLVPGLSLHDELVELVKGGLTPLEALQAATINPAEYLGLSDAGGVAPGKRADFLVLNADPLANIQNTKQIAAVVLGGHLIDRHELDQMLDAARTRASNGRQQ